MRSLKIKNYTLENGLKVLLVETGPFPTFTALLLVRAGSRYETKRENGIAHFFEHMAFKGSKKYPDARLLSAAIEGVGGEFNAFTDRTHTGYWVKAPSKYLSLVLDVLSDMVQNPLLKEEEIERERQVIIEEINMYEDLPQYKVIREFVRLVYGDHPLGRPILGPKENILRFKREDFISYLEKLYGPSNAWLVLAGGLGGEVESIVEEKLSGWRKKDVDRTFRKFASKQKNTNVKIIKKDVQQAHLVVGMEGISMFDEERYALSVAEAILGGGMASRLFWQLRERRGWCYYVSTSASFYEETGLFYSRAGIVTSKQNVEEAVKIIVSEYEKIANGDFSDKELARAKEYIKGGYLLSLEDSYNLASSLGRKFMFFGKVIRPKDVVEKIDRVEKDEVTKVFKRIFSKDKLNIAVISPFESFKFF